MNTTCPEPHARWLEAVLADGPEAAPEDALAELAACAHCSQELAELGPFRRLLDEAAAREREALAEAARAAGPAEERLMRATYDQRIAPGRKAWRPVLGIALAAAAVAALLMVLNRRAGEFAEPPGEILLAPRELELLEPVGPVAGFVTLRWSDALDPERTYDVRVWAVPEDGEPSLLLERERLEANEFVLEDTEPWPNRIVWSVDARDRSGRLVPGASASAEAWRR